MRLFPHILFKSIQTLSCLCLCLFGSVLQSCKINGQAPPADVFRGANQNNSAAISGNAMGTVGTSVGTTRTRSSNNMQAQYYGASENTYYNCWQYLIEHNFNKDNPECVKCFKIIASNSPGMPINERGLFAIGGVNGPNGYSEVMPNAPNQNWRNIIQPYLSSNGQMISYRSGAFNQGGAGQNMYQLCTNNPNCNINLRPLFLNGQINHRFSGGLHPGNGRYISNGRMNNYQLNMAGGSSGQYQYGASNSGSNRYQYNMPNSSRPQYQYSMSIGEDGADNQYEISGQFEDEDTFVYTISEELEKDCEDSMFNCVFQGNLKNIFGDSKFKGLGKAFLKAAIPTVRYQGKKLSDIDLKGQFKNMLPKIRVHGNILPQINGKILPDINIHSNFGSSVNLDNLFPDIIIGANMPDINLGSQKTINMNVGVPNIRAGGRGQINFGMGGGSVRAGGGGVINASNGANYTIFGQQSAWNTTSSYLYGASQGYSCEQLNQSHQSYYLACKEMEICMIYGGEDC